MNISMNSEICPPKTRAIAEEEGKKKKKKKERKMQMQNATNVGSKQILRVQLVGGWKSWRI